MKRIVLVFALACLMAISLNAQGATVTAKVGLAGAQFLKIPIGGQAAALDASAMPLVNDASAVFSNPAGLNHIVNSNSVFVSHSSWFADVQLNAGSYVHSFGGQGKVGVFFAQMNSGDMAITTVEDQTGEFSGTFSAVSTVIGISGARLFTDRFGVGLTAKLVTENMANGVGADDFGKGSAVALDIGTWYDTGIKGVKFSAVVQNFGPEITPNGIYYDYDRGDTVMTSVPGDVYGTKDQVAQEFSFRPYSLPMIFNFGITFSPIENLDVSLTTVQPNDNLQRYLVGMQYSVMGMATFRGSYAFGGYPIMTGWDDDDTSVYESSFFGYDDRAFSGGMGLKFGNIGLDFAYIQHTVLDPVYNGSVNFTF
ncbi:MAG: PorV/PorQ family protein [Candidatus Marinimicrobia bacterium]|nr:PorV/PorQ family protein [Candidatus Neomarinimicrobiota bacterium]